MTKYAVLLHARSITLLNKDSQRKPGGMYTWRVVEAASPEKAEQRARISLLSDDAFLEEVWKIPKEGDIEVEEIEVLVNPAGRDGGLVFYFDDPSDEVLRP